MKLDTWIQLSGKSVRAVAEEIGVSNENTVYRWIRGERMPRPKHLLKIFEISEGAVTANDFVNGSNGVAA